MFDFFSENPVLGALAVGVIGYLAVRLNKRIDAKQKDALKTASKLSELGMPLLATIFQDVAVGDITGAIKNINDLKEQLTDPEQRGVIFKRLVRRYLEDVVKDPDQRAWLMKLQADLQRQFDPDQQNVKIKLEDTSSETAPTATKGK